MGMPEFDHNAVYDSWKRVEEVGDQLPLRFYAILFRAHPDLRAKYPVSMAALRDKVKKTIAVIMEALISGDLESKLDKIRELGYEHATQYGVHPHHYPMVGGALLSALRYYDPDWNDDLQMDWSLAYGVIAEVMLQGVPEEVATA